MNHLLSKLGFQQRTSTAPPESSATAAVVTELAPPDAASPSAPPSPPGAGFTSVIRHLPLRGWLSWIHSNRSDATLRVRTMEGGSGRIWCTAGEVVDAEWGDKSPEVALKDMLELASGAVTIDFDPVQRARTITRPTQEIVQPSSARSSRHGWADSYLAGLCLLAALAGMAFGFGRLWATRWSSQAAPADAVPTEQVKSGLLPPKAPAAAAQPHPAEAREELSPISFSTIEVDPPGAEIWLDQTLLGTGRVQLAPVRDGAAHQLRFVAPGHEMKLVVFSELPPAGRVTLQRLPEPATGETSAGGDSAPEPVAETAAASDPTPAELELDGPAVLPREIERPAPRRRVAAAPRPRPSQEAPVVVAEPAPVKKAPNVQLIEVQTPRVEVIE